MGLISVGKEFYTIPKGHLKPNNIYLNHYSMVRWNPKCIQFHRHCIEQMENIY